MGSFKSPLLKMHSIGKIERKRNKRKRGKEGKERETQQTKGKRPHFVPYPHGIEDPLIQIFSRFPPNRQLINSDLFVQSTIRSFAHSFVYSFVRPTVGGRELFFMIIYSLIYSLIIFSL